MSMPSVPISIMIQKEIILLTEGKTIADARYEMYYEGRYSWQAHSFVNLDKILNARISYADAHSLCTDNGYLIRFGYFNGDLRYFNDVSDIKMNYNKKSVTNGYLIKIIFTDYSCIALIVYGWATHFIISKKTDDPLFPTAPIDVTNQEAFTLESFKTWLAGRGNENIIENCSTARGAFDIYNPVMSSILLKSGIHPKTKTKKLTQEEIEKIFYNTKALIQEYQSGARICEYSSLSGKLVEAENDILWLNSKTLGKPCPLCGTPIDAVPCAGTKIYFCPACQVLKK